MASIVVTGVSTGIGWGCLKVMTEAGHRVFGSVRKQADADRLSQEFGDRFVPLIFDVTDEAAVHGAATKVRNALEGEPLMGLVNNAGIAVAGPLLHLPVEQFRQQMETNVTGVVISTQAFAPLLRADDKPDGGKTGRIVNISSVGGKTGTPFMAPYNASKFAIEGLSEALRRELLVYGIDVIVIAPGAVSTAIWGKSDDLDVTPYASTAFAEPLERLRAYMRTVADKGLAPETLGKAVLNALTTAYPHVRYTVTPEPVQNVMSRVLPKRALDRALGKALGLRS